MADESVQDAATATDAEAWRSEIGFLGTILGETIRNHAGQDAFELVERIRKLSWLRRTGEDDAGGQLKQLLSGLDETQIRVVVRSFTIFLDLLNLVEDRTRTQVLRSRSESAHPGTRAESIGQAFKTLHQDQVSGDDLQRLLDDVNVELVFTAHPTEAKRRSVRRKLRHIRSLAATYHDEPLEHRRSKLESSICRELALLWQTNFIRPWRPSVLQEVERGLSVTSVIWDVIPAITKELQLGCAEHYGSTVKPTRPAVTFGSWIGGDRDGHPGVTFDVTEKTLRWLRREALEKHLSACDQLFHTLTVSNRQVDLGQVIQQAVDQAIESIPAPAMESMIAPIPPGELVRRWLAVIRWKLQQTLDATINPDDGGNDQPVSGYRNADELLDDLQILTDSISGTPTASLTLDPLLAWKAQIETFGFHLAKLDVRQNSKVYREVINELLIAGDAVAEPEKLDEAGRCEVLLGSAFPLPPMDSLSEDAQELLTLFGVLHEHAITEGMDAMGAQIVSMTSCVSDILSVGWLWKLTRPHGCEMTGTPSLVPLLETVDDLQNGPGVLESLLSMDQYRKQLKDHDDRQMIMLGYSDSTKDGGYLSACWALHECQRSLSDVAKKHGVSLTFFHGRGGSLGRGGGPAARSILSLPQSTFDGSIRITEQGEVLAERYDDAEIAHRHLEQIVWSSLLAAGRPSERPKDAWVDVMGELAVRSRGVYRELVEHPRFVDFFRTVTPIAEIEQLPIGSRPSRRKPGGGLSDLRAIPWVFSWTQCRCLLPAWFGLGTAISEHIERAGVDTLREMYTDWPFFRATIDNAELALAKADKDIMREYFQLGDSDTQLNEVAATISRELQQTVDAVLAVAKIDELLANTEWLKESIRVRNRFIDPLNLLQIEMMRRWADESPEEAAEEHRHLMRLAVNGVASGMRTSG